ncbi:HipA N-terminal domain-containing protein [Glutamicibacter sp. NPDC087344]|uniref:HipA N-terminal domain-containing protein n=1 Tax=Glutamicibacter sp. NPDC087344 TaxID=3363994 RepID=UPI00380914F0
MKELLTCLYGDVVGVLQQTGSGNRKFQYLPGGAQSVSLSLSMPYREDAYPRAVTDPFIEGLIPEGEAVRQSFAEEFSISAQNPFALLEHIGLDCAGAVQFVRPEEVDVLLQSPGELIPRNDGPSVVDFLVSSALCITATWPAIRPDHRAHIPPECRRQQARTSARCPMAAKRRSIDGR